MVRFIYSVTIKLCNSDVNVVIRLPKYNHIMMVEMLPFLSLHNFLRQICLNLLFLVYLQHDGHVSLMPLSYKEKRHAKNLS